MPIIAIKYNLMRNLYLSRTFLDVAVPKPNVSAMCFGLRRRWGSKGDLAASLGFFTMHWILKELCTFFEGLVEILEGLCKTVSAQFLPALWDCLGQGLLSCSLLCVLQDVVPGAAGLGHLQVFPVPEDCVLCAELRAQASSKQARTSKAPVPELAFASCKTCWERKGGSLPTLCFVVALQHLGWELPVQLSSQYMEMGQARLFCGSCQ